MTHADIKLYAMEWGTGRPLDRRPGVRPVDAAGIVVLEQAAQLAELLASDLVAAGSVVLVPGDVPEPARDHDGIAVITYQGSLLEPGAEVGLHPDFYLNVQTYAITGYLSVLGPTLVRVDDDGDRETYLEDADRARSEGTFPAFVTHPSVQLADLPALGGPADGDGPRLRLYVAADRTVRVTPAGAPLGELGDSFHELADRWEPAPPDAARPWLGRYLAALDAVRDARARGLDRLRVSGFGGRLVPALEEVPEAAAYDAHDAAVPLLLWDGDGHALLHDPATRRAVTLGPAAAHAAEALLVTGSRAAGTGYADPATVEAVDAYFAGIGLPLTSHNVTELVR